MSGVIARTAFITVTSLGLAAGCEREAASPVKSALTAASAEISPNSSAQQHAVRAYIDPSTGQLRDPTPAELAQEAAEQTASKQTSGSSQSETKQQEVVLADGTIEITLDKSTQHPLHACIQESGDTKVDHECEVQSSGVKLAGDKQ